MCDTDDQMISSLNTDPPSVDCCQMQYVWRSRQTKYPASNSNSKSNTK